MTRVRLKNYELVPFRFLVCPECKHQMCWVNPRLPNYCPECGHQPVGGHLGWRERVHMADDEAVLMTHNDRLSGGVYLDEKPAGFPS